MSNSSLRVLSYSGETVARVAGIPGSQRFRVSRHLPRGFMLISQIKKNRFWFISGILWFALVLFLSLTSSRRIIGLVGSFHFGEQAAHALSYGLLAFCFYKVFQKSLPSWAVGAFCFGLGMLVEVLQALGGYRGFELVDIISNLAGIFIGYLAYLTLGSREFLFR
jgi:glycopeptide antibiotics resistance protein